MEKKLLAVKWMLILKRWGNIWRKRGRGEGGDDVHGLGFGLGFFSLIFGVQSASIS